MANSANPEINKKIATSALGTLVIATVFFYLGDRYAETLVTYPGQIFDHLSDAFLSMWQTIKDAPFALDMTSNSLLFGGACFLIIWMIWLRYVAFIGNYRSGEESGSARWGTVKEGKKFKDLQTEDNNLLFTKNFGLALHRPKFDPEYDRNLNVLVVGGSGSGKTFNYVTPNICQLNTSYFVTDPRVYARAGHPVGGNGNTQLGNQGYGANYSQKRATTDLSQIKVGMLISAQYGSNTPAGNAYGHVGIYIGDGKVMDSIYSGLRTISLSDWVSQNGRGWVVCGYPWDWR